MQAGNANGKEVDFTGSRRDGGWRERWAHRNHIYSDQQSKESGETP